MTSDNWLMQEFERARKRSAQIPLHARPIRVKKGKPVANGSPLEDLLALNSPTPRWIEVHTAPGKPRPVLISVDHIVSVTGTVDGKARITTVGDDDLTVAESYSEIVGLLTGE